MVQRVAALRGEAAAVACGRCVYTLRLNGPAALPADGEAPALRLASAACPPLPSMSAAGPPIGSKARPCPEPCPRGCSARLMFSTVGGPGHGA